MFSENEFNTTFARIPNNADGNCFFEAMEYVLQEKHANRAPSSTKIRQMVADFYKEFDMDIDYPMDTIEYNIKLGVMFDNMDGNGDPNSLCFDDMPIRHIYNIAHNYVWASMTDVLVCALLFEINIDLYKKCGGGDGFEEVFVLEKIISQYTWKDTVSIYYNGINHFEALYSL